MQEKTEDIFTLYVLLLMPVLLLTHFKFICASVSLYYIVLYFLLLCCLLSTVIYFSLL